MGGAALHAEDNLGFTKQGIFVLCFNDWLAWIGKQIGKVPREDTFVCVLGTDELLPHPLRSHMYQWTIGQMD